MSGPLAALGAVGKAALSIAARSFLSVETPPYASSGHVVSTVKKIKRGWDISWGEILCTVNSLVLARCVSLIKMSVLRLVFTSDGVGVRVVISRLGAYDLVKTAFRLRLQLCLLRSAYHLVKTRLLESEAEAEELNQSQSMGMCIVIGLSFRSCFWQSGFH